MGCRITAAYLCIEEKGNDMIKNIILDVGKVLVEWDPNYAFQKLGFDENASRLVAEATVLSPEWNELDRSKLSDQEILAKFIANAPEYEKEIRMVWENIGLPIWQYEYVKPWIRNMKQCGYHVYILSNYSRWTYENTQEALSFLQDVDGAVFSFQVQQIKPEPEIYQSLLKKYDLKAEECVFLDDRQENLDAAMAQGIAGIRFTGYEDALEQLCTYGVDLTK